jgi:hypothetical protein
MCRALAELMVREHLNYAEARERLIDLRYSEMRELLDRMAEHGALPPELGNYSRFNTEAWVDARLSSGEVVTVVVPEEKQ